LSVLLLLILATVALWAAWCFRDRHPNYVVDLSIDAASEHPGPASIRAGFARVTINPDLSNPARPVWIAGFSEGRAATAIHDDLWAVAGVIDDGRTRLGIVSLDAIGFLHDDVIEVRRRLPATLELDYVIICSTHNHSTPDLIGIWGPSRYRTGVDPAYREKVIAAAAQAVARAVEALQPARMSLLEIPTQPAGLVNDTRPPEVFDPDIRLMLFAGAGDSRVIGSIVSWANHPETVWSENTQITSDFPGYLRDVLENGVVHHERKLAAGLGGIHLYINGAVGGLMTPNPALVVQDPYLRQDFSKPSHEKARALGRNLAHRILARVPGTNAMPVASPRISVQARTLELPLDNHHFLLAPLLGLIDRGHVRWRTIRSEVALVTIGDASIAAIPGEIYPEIVNGGIVTPPGADFRVDPVEIPPLRDLMPGRVKFIFGLANDEIGYIIPKSEWNRKPPHLFEAHRPHYGEINSLGPETAGLIHGAVRRLISRLEKR